MAGYFDIDDELRKKGNLPNTSGAIQTWIEGLAGKVSEAFNPVIPNAAAPLPRQLGGPTAPDQPTGETYYNPVQKWIAGFAKNPFPAGSMAAEGYAEPAAPGAPPSPVAAPRPTIPTAAVAVNPPAPVAVAPRLGGTAEPVAPNRSIAAAGPSIPDAEGGRLRWEGEPGNTTMTNLFPGERGYGITTPEAPETVGTPRLGGGDTVTYRPGGAMYPNWTETIGREEYSTMQERRRQDTIDTALKPAIELIKKGEAIIAAGGRRNAKTGAGIVNAGHELAYAITGGLDIGNKARGQAMVEDTARRGQDITERGQTLHSDMEGRRLALDSMYRTGLLKQGEEELGIKKMMADAKNPENYLKYVTLLADKTKRPVDPNDPFSGETTDMDLASGIAKLDALGFERPTTFKRQLGGASAPAAAPAPKSRAEVLSILKQKYPGRSDKEYESFINKNKELRGLK